MGLKKQSLRCLLALLIIHFLLPIPAQAEIVEILAIRHAESMNNILSQAKNPFRFVASTYSERKKLKATGSLFTNPVLSKKGRDDTRAIHNLLFPGNKDKYQLFSSDSPYTAVLVSPLNRTIQTSMLLFGTQLFRNAQPAGLPAALAETWAGTPLIPLEYISEYRKSISEDGTDVNRALSIFQYEQQQMEKQGLKLSVLDSPSFNAWQSNFAQELITCCREPWWPQGNALERTHETPANLNRRQDLLKSYLAQSPHKKVLLVSHGTFLRTLFFGAQELKAKQYHLKNVGMIHALFDTSKKSWTSVKCWDPKTGKDADDSVCFDHSPKASTKVAPNPNEVSTGAMIKKAPTSWVGVSNAKVNKWQERYIQLEYSLEGNHFPRITWRKKPKSKILGAAEVMALHDNPDDCGNKPKSDSSSEVVCLQIIAFEPNSKKDSVDWTKPSLKPGGKSLRVLRLLKPGPSKQPNSDNVFSELNRLLSLSKE